MINWGEYLYAALLIWFVASLYVVPRLCFSRLRLKKGRRYQLSWYYKKDGVPMNRRGSVRVTEVFTDNITGPPILVVGEDDD